MKHLFSTFGAFIVFSICAAAYAFLVHDIQALTERIYTAAVAAATVEERALRERSAEKLFADIALEHAALARRVVADQDVALPLNSIDAVARQVKAVTSISSISTRAIDGAEAHEDIVIVFSAQAPLNRLVELATLLDAIPYATILENASFTLSAEQQWFGTFTISFLKEKKTP